MLVVVAGCFDEPASRFVDDARADSCLLTSRDLSTKGWRYRPGSRSGTAVVEGTPVSIDTIDGVLTRLPSVPPHELSGIVPEDRGYAAAEMTAFLAAWLSELDCPVFNRPTAECLMGPFWRRERWVAVASDLGIPVQPFRRAVPVEEPYSDPSETTTVTVVAGSALPGTDDMLSSWAESLAGAAGVGLLRATFRSSLRSPAFVDADYWVDLSDPNVGETLRRTLAMCAFQ